LLEATAFGVRHNLAAFTAIGAEPTRVVAVGGGAGDSIWPQIVSDVTGFAQDIPTETIGASYGDAHFAAIALGADPGGEWNSVRRRIDPDSAASALYDDLFADYLKLRDATTDIQHRLARRQR
jgi:xylulokinase